MIMIVSIAVFSILDLVAWRESRKLTQYSPRLHRFVGTALARVSISRVFSQPAAGFLPSYRPNEFLQSIGRYQ